MSEWIDIDDGYKPEIGEEVLIRIPLTGSHVIESATYIGGGVFVGAWCENRGYNCAYDVDHWMKKPEDPV